MKPKILVVDDESEVLDLITYNLKAAGYDSVTAEDGAAALKIARRELPNLIILDLMMPEMSGLEVCKALRREAAFLTTPILMLTARAGEIDRVLGLELGANDYVTKPFSMRELMLRVKNLLSRPAATGASGSELHRIGELALDIAKHEVTVKGSPIELTATEFKLLAILLERRGRVQSRDKLLQDVWEYDSIIDTRTVDTHMRRLRQKLGSAAKHLETVRGVGYRITPDAT